MQARISAPTHSSSLGRQWILRLAGFVSPSPAIAAQRDWLDGYSNRRQSTRPPVSVGDLQACLSPFGTNAT
jgi:hypothetical protein